MRSSMRWLFLAVALSSGLVAAEEPNEVSETCTGIVTDETDPKLREYLARPDVSVYQVGETRTVRVSKDKTVSTVDVVWVNSSLNDPLPEPGKVECILECSGPSCSGYGCQAHMNGSCTPFSCSGNGCSGKCTQKTVSGGPLPE